LPIPFAADAGRIGRCEREAKMLAWLRTLRLVHSVYFVELDRNWISFPKGTKTGTLTVCPLGVLKVPPSGTSARGERSFATHTPMVISSPCLKESFVTPCLVKELGLGISTSHLTTSPFSPFTSRWRKECGLIHSTPAITPLSVTSFVVSKYTAWRWCATSGRAMRLMLIETIDRDVILGRLRVFLGRSSDSLSSLDVSCVFRDEMSAQMDNNSWSSWASGARKNCGPELVGGVAAGAMNGRP